MKKIFLFLFVPFCSFANLELNLNNDIYLNYTIAKNTKLLYSNSFTAKYGKQLKGYISSTIYFDNSSLNELGLEYVKKIANSKIKIKVGTNLSSANNFKPIYLSSIEINQKNIVNSHVHFVIGLKLFNYGNSHGIGLTSDINIH